MIQLNTDTALLNKYFGISLSKIYTNYANKDFEEIMKIEAEQGNKKAEDYEKILTDPNKILEIFNLVNIENKYAILQNMSEDDLDALLPLLNNEQLPMGLNFFTDEKLISMAKELPIEELVCMIFEKFQLNEVLELMEDSAMEAFLEETKVKRSYMQNYFESLGVEELRNIMQIANGVNYKDKDKKSIIDELNQMQDNEYQIFATSLDRDSTIELIGGICKQEEDLLLLFNPDDLVKPMELLMKSDKIKMMKGLEQEFLVPMIQELPVDLTQIVLTQIDPKDFAETLSSEFTEILKSVVLFAN